VGPAGQPLPLVTTISDFNQVEYYKTTRRFVLGAVTYYEGPDVWALEIAPYDTASPEMITTLYQQVRDAAYFGPGLAFHPTSTAVEEVAAELEGVRLVSTDELFAKIDFQPLNLATTAGQVRFLTAEQLETEYVGFRDIVVLDRVPNDISVVAGMITEEFQTPLSHVNILAQNRGTPNMGLRGAMSNTELRALEGRWVRLTVGASDWSVTEITKEEADAHWDQTRPEPVALPDLDLTVTDLRDIKQVVPEPAEGQTLRDVIKTALQAFGTKASNYSVLTNTPGVPIRPGFAIPVYYYVQFMEENGFFDRVNELLVDPEFLDSAAVRDQKLAELRSDMAIAPVNQQFQDLLRTKLETDFPGQSMRFRTSTNAEDLDGFPCAGCYESHTGDPGDWDGDLLTAIRETWAGVWFFRTFEERTYNGIEHTKVGMSLLVHHNFPAEEANGVASTANPFDPTGLEPGFYVNVQWGGDAEVVHPPPNVTSDEFIYYWSQGNRTTDYLGHSNIIPEDTTVLNDDQLIELGTALAAIHERFVPAYGPGVGTSDWYAMDVEFKYDDEGTEDGIPHLWVKQARPYPGRGGGQ
jgi:pyruvate, water dikinase